MPRFAILDPLTLVGRELHAEFRRRFPEASLSLFHTSDDQEHQIASVAGQAALVPPLSESNELKELDVVLYTADQASKQLKILETVLADNPELIFIDASPLSHYRKLTSPALDADGMTKGARLRPAHPSIAVASTVVGALTAFQPTTATIASVEPVSIFGKDAIGILAHQASQRLQGENVTKTINNHVAAFNMTALSSTDLAAEASELLSDLEVTATRTLGGCFHGHLTLLGISFASEFSLEAIIDTLKLTPGIALKDYPVRLDAVGDSDEIFLTHPVHSGSKRSIAIQAMVDGTRIGGAVTVASILQGLQ